MVTRILATAMERGAHLVYPDRMSDVVEKMVTTASRMAEFARDSFSAHALVPKGTVIHEDDLLALFARHAKRWGLLEVEAEAPSPVEIPVCFDVMKMQMMERVSVATADLLTLKQEIFRVFWIRFHKEFHTSEEPTAEGLLLRGRALHFILHLRKEKAERVDASDVTLKFKRHLPSGLFEIVEIRNEEELRKYLLNATGDEEISGMDSKGMRYNFEWFRKMFQTTVKVHGTAERVILRYFEPGVNTLVDTDEKLGACLARLKALDSSATLKCGFESFFKGGHPISAVAKIPPLS